MVVVMVGLSLHETDGLGLAGFQRGNPTITGIGADRSFGLCPSGEFVVFQHGKIGNMPKLSLVCIRKAKGSDKQKENKEKQ